MKAFFVVMILILLLVPTVIAGKIAQRYYSLVPGVSSVISDNCNTGYKCEDNKYNRCIGGKWHVLDMCTTGEQCMAGGCRTVRMTRFPQVTITQSMMPVRPYVYVTNGSVFRNTARVHS
jgi:hypothetical protein